MHAFSIGIYLIFAFSAFSISFTTFVFPTTCLKFSKLFSACWNYSSTFSFLQKIPKIFFEFQNPLEKNLNIFSSKILAEHPMVIFHMTVGAQQPKGSSSGPTRGVGRTPRSAEPW
jgi:hypothetical protein